MIRWILMVALLSTGLHSQDLKQLPVWVARVAQAAASEPAPLEADAWILLDRTEIAYVGDGEIRTHRFRVVKILDDRGLGEAVYALRGLGGKASKVKRLLGWNLRPDGDLVKLDMDSAVTVDGDSEGEISTGVLTAAQLPRVVKGSLLAFESLESIHHPMGPTAVTGLMENNPVRQWELEAVASGGWFTNLSYVVVRMDVRHLEPWAPAPEIIQGKSIKVRGLPAIPRHEDASPHARNSLPTVLVRFQDPGLINAPSTESWDSLASWVDGQYQKRFQASRLVDSTHLGTKAFLEAVHSWMTKELSYKQVYLTPQRGWIPDLGPEIVRHRYGDCKDLTCCLLSEAKGFGLEVHPVMAMIGHGFIEDGEAPSFASFDHVISAIALKESLGFPAEVDTPQGRFLLVDPTSRLTPLGWLPAVHRDRRVMVCTPRGALWVTVPASAVQLPATLITIQGEVDAAGAATATLAFQETANHLGLREAARAEGHQGLRDLLMPFLDLAPTATFKIQSAGDPLDLSKPFSASVVVTQIGALRREGHDEVLVNWGMPSAPRIIQKPGMERHFPVESTRQGRLELNATYRLPFAVEALLPTLDLKTAFSTLLWKVETLSEGGHPSVQFHCTQVFEPVYFDFRGRETGVREWKKDRSQLVRLRLDGLSFARKE